MNGNIPLNPPLRGSQPDLSAKSFYAVQSAALLLLKAKPTPQDVQKLVEGCHMYKTL